MMSLNELPGNRLPCAHCIVEHDEHTWRYSNKSKKENERRQRSFDIVRKTNGKKKQRIISLNTCETMNLSVIFIGYFLVVQCFSPVENHFFHWIWNKIQRIVDPIRSQRSFDCGRTDIQPNVPVGIDTARVTGGLSAIDHSFPWMVNVLNVKSLKSCGGSIVGPDTVLTGR
jgi:hypothetical protein